MEAVKQYFKDDIFVTNLAIERIGNTENAHTSISISHIKLGKLLDRTLESKGNAHIVVYYVGEHLKSNGNFKIPFPVFSLEIHCTPLISVKFGLIIKSSKPKTER